MLTVVCGGHIGADLIGFGRAEFGEQVEGLLAVAGLGGSALSAAGLGEAVVGAGLLILVTNLRGKVECGVVFGAGDSSLSQPGATFCRLCYVKVA